MIANIAPAASPNSDTENDVVELELAEPPARTRFTPFFISRSEIGRSRTSAHFIMILVCIILPLVIGASLMDELNFSKINPVVLALEILCVLFVLFGINLFYRFCKGVQSIEIGYDPMNDTQLIIRHKKCFYFQSTCWCCCFWLKYCFVKDYYRDLHSTHKVTKVIKAEMIDQSEGSNKHLYIIELQTQNRKEWKCRLDQFNVKKDATTLVNDINKHLDKNRKFQCEAMVDYA